jgi:PEP-CTERM motif
MNRFAVSFALAALSLTAPVSASITIPGNPVTLTSAQEGTSFTRNYAGYVNETLISGLTGQITFTLQDVSADLLTWTFLATVKNTTVAPVGSRLNGFGMQVAPDVLNATAQAGGTFSTVGFNRNFNQLDPNLELCFSSGNGACPNGGGGLTNVDDPMTLADERVGSQVFSLIFGSAPANNSITLSQFAMRFQSITGVASCGNTTNCTSGVGIGYPPGDPNDPFGNVPEPSSWAMMIAGFGLVGAAARRRNRRSLTVAA